MDMDEKEIDCKEEDLLPYILTLVCFSWLGVELVNSSVVSYTIRSHQNVIMVDSRVFVSKIIDGV